MFCSMSKTCSGELMECGGRGRTFKHAVRCLLKREASKIGIQLVSKPSLTIGSLLCSKAKHHLPKLQESNVVYKIECSCQVDGDPVVYIGETDRHARRHEPQLERLGDINNMVEQVNEFGDVLCDCKKGCLRVLAGGAATLRSLCWR
ncbi:hypothetical protein FJT64_002529 [Amphibalanus amphitrite]|uniref:Uncharacterized protein n=1 Tax=Amphibalanus amphitrite TaxID=1232801 RepID=A0A6A4WKA3_AMPAM|nr:hypothetical protein FJT64_002529 [Amphibalanus amphitrite]